MLNMLNTSKHQQQNDGIENVSKKRKQRKPWCQNHMQNKNQINTSLISGLCLQKISNGHRSQLETRFYIV
jgi:hypothetical protein